MLSRCFLDFSVGIGAFAIGLGQIYSFFSFKKPTKVGGGGGIAIRQQNHNNIGTFS